MSVLNCKMRAVGTVASLLILMGSLTILYTRFSVTIIQMVNQPVATEEDLRKLVTVDGKFDFGARNDVQTSTPWNAPIVWEGTFDPDVHDKIHIQRKSSVALTVFALGRYTDVYLKNFLMSAEKHFMLGLPVRYYVFTEAPEKVPRIWLGPQRSMKVILIEKQDRWQDISMMRMRSITDIIETEIRHSFRYVFCFDVDQQFEGRFGSEALGESVALLHAYFYSVPKYRFTYDKNQDSKAFMKTGDFYYHAAIFGGFWENVKNLSETCLRNILMDKVNDVEALWHDESHLNKYYWLNKPTKVLSPEYCWDVSRPDKDILVQRLIWAPKFYDTLRIVGHKK